MNKIGMAKTINLFAGNCLNQHFNDDFPSGKFYPSHSGWGGGGVTAGPALQALGCQVVMYGRYSPGQEPLRDLMISQGIRWGMERVETAGAVNAILPGPRVLRVIPAAPCVFSTDEGRALSASGAVAFALAGSLDHDYAEAIIEVAAAKGVHCFVNPGGSFDLTLLDRGGLVHLQVSYDEFGGDAGSPSTLARKLLLSTAAVSVVVTDAERGAWGICRGDRSVLHAPAVSVIEPIRLLGAGDAHFAGFISTFLDAPKEIRLQQGLTVARLVAARHVAGLNPGDWLDLSRFQAQLDQVPALRAVA